MKEIIINTDNQGNNTIALLENGILTEQYIDKNQKNVLEGNIYCGVVKTILPGMQSAFVDIGEEKNAFIHIKDIIPKANNQTGNKEEILKDYKIRDYIQQNMPILVQVKKDEEAQKGARISKHISITGRIAILLIGMNFITVSQKIEDLQEKQRIKQISEKALKKYLPQEYGLILRTAAVNKSEQEIEKDIEELISLWEKIKINYDEILQNPEPKLIYKNYNIISKFLTSVLETDIDRVITNNEKIYRSIEKYLKEINKANIQLELKHNVMKMYDLEEKIEKTKQRKIWLRCGGFITIDKTEALTAIDVNSGKFIGNKKDSKENTIIKVNKEATCEIAKQLRLRNISGIIVIDYIDMEEDEDRQNIIKLLQSELKKDRSKTQVIGFTKLDLLEMTRKKI